MTDCAVENCALCRDNGETCRICSNGFTLNDQNECEPIPITCSIENCASCDDESTCKECNAPYQLVGDEECQLCEEGTYYDENEKSCEGIISLNKNNN